MTAEHSALDPSIDCMGYIRVSTERQAGEQYTSLADQEKAIVQLATKLGRGVGVWFRDEGASGATVAGRPAFRAMLSACEAAPRPKLAPGLVLVLNDSRFGRFPDPDEAAALRFRFKQAGWIVRFAEGDDTEDVTFRSVIRSLGSAQASEYRRNLQRNSRRGKRGSAENGYWTCRAPFGYRRIVVYPPGAERVLAPGAHKAPNEKISLVPEETREAPIVRWMFDAYAAGGWSLGKLARELTRRAPERRWVRNIVQVMLQNPVYMGDIVAGRRPASRTEQEIWSKAPAHEWYGKRDAHPALISRALWHAVQARLKENKWHTKAPQGDYILSGLLTCARCGCTYTGGGGGRKKNTPAEKRRFYKDSASYRRVACPGPIGTVTRRIVEGAVLDVLTREIRKRSMRARIERELDRVLTDAPTVSGEMMLRLQRDVRAVERKRDRLVALLADATITHDEGAAQLTQVRAELARLTDAIDAARHAAQAPKIAEAERERMLGLALDFPAMAARCSGPELRELIRPWLAAATFDKVTRVVTLSIRRVPALPGMHLSTLPGQGGQSKARERYLVRRIFIGSAPAMARNARLAAAGGGG